MTQDVQVSRFTLEAWIRRAIAALQEGDKDFAEELLVDILFLIGRGP